MTRKESKDKRIGDVIQAAVNEFLEKGYEGASMEAIAQGAGLSKGGLYHHFKSKDEILLLANKELSEPIIQMTQQALKKSSALEGLTWYIEHYIQYWVKHPKELVFFFLSVTKVLDTPPLWEMYEQYTQANLAFFQKLFQRGIDSGEFLSHSAYTSAVTLMSALDGMVGYLVMDRNLKPENIIAIFQEKFVYSLQPQKRNGGNQKENQNENHPS